MLSGESYVSEQSYARWLTENDPSCQSAFKISAQAFARAWRAGAYGPVAELEMSGNWQDELIVRLGRSLDEADAV
jgi:hypothetical protein